MANSVALSPDELRQFQIAGVFTLRLAQGIEVVDASVAEWVGNSFQFALAYGGLLRSR